MSGHMKKRPTKVKGTEAAVLLMTHNDKIYAIPRHIADQYAVNDKNEFLQRQYLPR